MKSSDILEWVDNKLEILKNFENNCCNSKNTKTRSKIRLLTELKDWIGLEEGLEDKE